jgi:hypothetical protein
MNAQEMFDTIVRAGRDQGRFSMSADGSSCSYRGAHGDKCFFGHVIPDSLYEYAMEGVNAGVLVDEWTQQFEAIGISYDLGALANDMQTAHDDSAACRSDPQGAFEMSLPQRLAKIADRHGLNPASIYEAPWIYKPE